MIFIYLVILLLTLLVITYAKKYYYFKNRGIPADLPPFLFGLEVFLGNLDTIHLNKTERLGNFYGSWLGSLPLITISDPEMIKIITVKEFNNFTDRNPIKFGMKYMEDGFAMKKGNEWKKGRTLVSPVFTTKKVKDIFGQFRKASRPLFLNIEELIEQSKQDEIDVKALLKGYSLDVIAKFVYALELNSAKDKNHPFVKNVMKLVNFNTTFFNIVLNFLPKKIVRYFDIQLFDTTSLEYLANITRLLIKQRREDGNKENYNDFLDLLLNTIDEKKLDVSEEEIIGNCIVFFFGGLESVSATISLALWLLALNPEWQDKLFDELIDLYPTKEINYENIKDSKILDSILKESQRIFPVAKMIFRIADSPIEIKGLKIEANDVIAIDVFSLHNNPDFWPEPRKFNPTRFLENDLKFENDESTKFLPFGNGPRVCVAARLALIQSRFVIAQLVLNYEIYRSKFTDVPIKFDKNPGQFNFRKMLLGFRKRSHKVSLNLI